MNSRIFLQNFYFLIINKSSFRVIFKYLNFSLFYFLNLEKINKVNRLEGKKLAINKRITKKWFFRNIFFWNKILKEHFKKKIEILEIGSFEGTSSIYFMQKFSKAKITCVDTFKGSQEQVGIKDFSNVEKSFMFNLLKYKKRVNKFKGFSSLFFKKNKKLFDIIYIDGSHKYKDVYNDGLSADKILVKNGLMIFDDFFWRFYNNDTNPMCAINDFISINKHKYKIIYVSQQIFLKKIL